MASKLIKPDCSLKKEERLKSKKILARIFTTGRSFNRYPILGVWLVLDTPGSPAPVQFTVSVSKKKFPKAVDRNRIKRQTREAFRLHKHLIYEAGSPNIKEQQFALVLIYIAKEKKPFSQIEKGVVSIIKKLIKEQHSAD